MRRGFLLHFFSQLVKFLLLVRMLQISRCKSHASILTQLCCEANMTIEKSPHAKPPIMFVNLIIKDLPRSMKFFEALGYYFNLEYTGPRSSCLVFGEQNCCMLVEEEEFKSLLGDDFAKANLPGSGWIAFSCASREEVDEMVRRAVKAGGKIVSDPRDLGFMYSHGFQDLDGHTWAYHWMNPEYRG